MKLALFFTRGISLEYWLGSGLLDREKLIYEEHLKRQNLSEIYWFTYGIKDSLIADSLKKHGRLDKRIKVLEMPKVFWGKLGTIIYSLLMPLIKYRHIRKADVFKTNQIDGAWSAVLSKWLYRKPLIVRTGYTLSFVLSKNKVTKLKKRIYEYVEFFSYKFADIGFVTSNHDKDYLTQKHSWLKGKVKILPNYINADTFCPAEQLRHPNKIVFVGRLSSEKNLFNLIEAVSKTNFSLDIYGKGPLESQLQDRVKEINANVNFMGVIKNSELSDKLNRYRYYILPSLYEGMPKTLLEAMACGLVCIGTDVEGIREIIQHNVNGFLCGTDADAIRDSILKNFSQNSSNKNISENARRTILDNYSLPTVVEREQKIFKKLVR